MSNNQVLHMEETEEYRKGYDAYCAGEPFDPNASYDWNRGRRQAQRDEDVSESAKT